VILKEPILMRTLTLSALCLVLAVPTLGRAQTASPGNPDFTPDPEKVLRWGKGYCYPQQGWIVVHVEGQPYERGYQQGRLLASEIAAYVKCFAAHLDYKSPTESWKSVRMFANALFLRKFEKEFLEEMKGIADGAAAAGARFGERPIDLVDIVAMNCWSEIESLDDANKATPTGLDDRLFRDPQPQAKPLARPDHCSAFAATGPATADGKIVFGHITMFPLYPAGFYNVWLDVQPAKGHRFVMCSYPGGIQSGMDYYINDAGLLINETTIQQTRFNVDGMTCASRIRQAIQYADNIDKAVEILLKDNNGLYTNEWLLADLNTNEIAMFEIGTYKHKLWRSSKNEWFGDTPGFYWGCNNTKDIDVRLETVANVKGKPANVVFHPEFRDLAWQKVYSKYKGKIGVEFAKEAFTSPALATPNNSLDAKFTTTELAKQLKSWAFFGPPTGKTWNPTKQEKEKWPEIKPLEPQSWTVLGITAPAKDSGKEAPIIAELKAPKAGRKSNVILPAVWRGTLLPKTDGDIWLAIAFAEYEKAVAVEHVQLRDGASTDKARAALDQRVAAFKTGYSNAAKKLDVPLSQLKSTTTSDDWYKLASNKGALLLHALRSQVGSEAFDKAMDAFGMVHGGERVTSQMFQEHMQKASGKNLDAFFKAWLTEKGLPSVPAEPAGNGSPGATAPAKQTTRLPDQAWHGRRGTPLLTAMTC
jgi:hypothetical protein